MQENYGRCARCGNPVRSCTCQPGIDYKSMSLQYFYENYFLVNGHKPSPLSEWDKELFAAFDNLKDGEQIHFFKGRGNYRLCKCIEEKALKSIENYVYQSRRYSLPPAK